MEIGLLTAFLGGVLALLSPCGALLLPAFFATAFSTRARLLLHATVFYAGLAATLVPLGLGLGALGSLFIEHRDVIIGGTAVVLVALGLAQALGFGFDLARVLPGADRVRQESAARSGLLSTLLLGAASGVAGFCAGPILGAVLTLAMVSGDSVQAGLLLAVYGAGMVVPLTAIAAGWERLGDRGRARLRGRGFVLLGRELHTTSVVTGVLIAVVAVLFWRTNGFLTMPSLLPTTTQAWLQARLSMLSGPLVDILAIGLAVAVALSIWWATTRRHT
ncbi:MAG TPA: cytochrome c biogenesis protein CcdA [Intrasporangiaceae bacterium]|nr:cytochrome c biogenesis protein CcdA [Intrasporangiaceae bacterium]